MTGELFHRQADGFKYIGLTLQGPTGVDGVDGLNGLDGIDGAVGPQGPAGNSHAWFRGPDTSNYGNCETLAVEGDYWLRTGDGRLFERTSISTWSYTGVHFQLGIKLTQASR